jgi:hypothetical protein
VQACKQADLQIGCRQAERQTGIRPTDGWLGMQVGRPANRVSDRWLGVQAGRETNKQGVKPGGWACRQGTQQTGGQTRRLGMQAGRQAGRQADQQTGVRPVNMYKNGGSRQRSMQHAGREKVSIRDNIFVL